jgi:transposase-like protein
VYVAIGVNLDGERDVLGLWLGPSGGEGAKQWATMLTELRNRGLQDALIVCCDGLKGLPESIRITWPDATVQTCVVHMVRNSLRYSSKKHWSKITAAMRQSTPPPTVEAAEARFADFAEEWEALYPAMIQAWRSVWTDCALPRVSPRAQEVVYTTNAIESLNARFRRAVRHRGHVPNEQAALKVLYLVAMQRRENRQDMTGKIAGWKTILNTLTVHYGDRIAASTIN